MHRFHRFGAASALGGGLLVACHIQPCPESDSPCPESYQVHEWCGADRCTLGDRPADCNAGGCLVRQNQLLVVPLSEILTQTGARDLHVGATNGGCVGTGTPTDTMSVAIDGVAGERFELEGTAGPVFRWNPFPEEPQVLELIYGDAEQVSCVNLRLWLIHAACEAENPEPTDCIPNP